MADITTCAVTAIVHSSKDGPPVAGAQLELQLSTFDIYQGFVSPPPIRGVTDANGQCVLELFPNELGQAATFYKVRIVAEGKTFRSMAVVPNQPTALLHEITAVPPYDGKPDGYLVLARLEEMFSYIEAVTPKFLPNAPTNPLPGSQWTDADTGKRYEWVVTASSSAWFEVGSAETIGYETAIQAAQSASDAADSAADAQTAETEAKRTLAVFSVTAPANPLQGRRWTNANTGKTYEWTVDSDGGQWVEMGPAQSLAANAVIDWLALPTSAAQIGAKADGADSAVMTVQEALALSSIDLLTKIPKSQWAAIRAGTSVYDCMPALVSAIATGKRVTVSMPGRYKFATAYNGTTDFDVEGLCQGIEFDVSAIAGIAFQNSGSIAQVGALSANIVQRRNTLTFSAPPALSPGDWFCVYNPTDSSYSGWRTYYRAGEWKQVLSVSGNTVTTTAPFYAGYTAGAVNIYRLSSVKSRMANLKLIGGTTPAQLVQFSMCVGPILDRIQFDTAQGAGLGFDRCVAGQVLLPFGRNTGAAGGSQYGFVNSNSQHTRVQGGDLYSTRHAVANGGGDVVCGVPVRDFRCYGTTLRNHPEQSVGAADMHGNTENSSFENCTIYGGANIQGGGDNWYTNCDIYAPGGEVQANAIGWVLQFAEVKGGAMGLRGCRLFTNRAPDASSRGIIDIGANSTAVSALTTDDLTIVVRDCKLYARNMATSQAVVRFTNRGSVAKVNFDIQNLAMDVDALVSVLRTDSASGTPASDFIIVDGISGAPAGSALHTAVSSLYSGTAFKHRLQRQAGVWQATSTATPELISGPITLPMTYPRPPRVELALSARDGASNYDGNVGAQRVWLSAYQASVNTIRPQIRAAATMTAGTNFDVHWSTEIREC